MGIAGGMTEAIHRGDDPTTWKDHASSSDMHNARYEMRMLGDKAKPWEEYAQETLALIREHWPKIEAVANGLLKHEILSSYDMDLISRNVVLRHHLKKHRAAAKSRR